MSWKCKIDDILIFSVSGAIMAKPPDEKNFVEIPFVEQLKGMRDLGDGYVIMWTFLGEIKRLIIYKTLKF